MPENPEPQPQQEPDDDLELRPLQRMHAEEDEAGVVVPPISTTPSRPPGAEPVPVPEGMVACSSCMQIKAEQDVTMMTDGRLMCRECAIAYRRTHAREESRMQAAARGHAWLDLSEGTAWTLTLLMPFAGWALLVAVMLVITRGADASLGAAFSGATLVMAGVLIETVITLLALGITALIFKGLDLPTVPNRLWKIIAMLVGDMALFLLMTTMWKSSPCMTMGYFVAARPLMLGVGMVVLLGLDTLEGAVATMITWAVVSLALVSAFTRGLVGFGSLS